MIDWTAGALGIIEGITEFLPISSTGHLLIAEHWLGQRSDTFNIVIQAGAILAVTLLYWSRLMELVFGWRENRDYAIKLATAFLVTAVLGFVAKKAGLKLPQTLAPVAWALLIGGIWMMMVESFAAGRSDRTQVTWAVAVVVGLAQVVAAILPGTSRSAATIFAAMLAGTTNRAVATEFAFLVGIPTMYAASAFELYGSLRTADGHENWSSLAIGFVISAITAFVAVKWLLGYIRSHRFTVFAAYRIAIGAISLLAVGGR
jgi:undecaprenyl-diphosphatase